MFVCNGSALNHLLSRLAMASYGCISESMFGGVPPQSSRPRNPAVGRLCLMGKRPFLAGDTLWLRDVPKCIL